MGALSDRFAHRIGKRLPQITVGITLAGMIFVITAVLLQFQLSGTLRWIVPVLMTLWVMAMLIFRGPAIALLRQFAPTRELPMANTILTLVFALSGAIGPLFLELIQQLGMSLTFVLGAVLLVGGGVILWSSRPELHLAGLEEPDTPAPTVPEDITLFCAGVGIGLLVNLLLRSAPTLLQPLLNWKTPHIAAWLLFLAALATLPMERLSNRLDLGRSLLISASWLSLNLVFIQLGFLPTLLPLMLLSTGVALGWIFVAQVPWALTAVAPDHAGFSVGLYFGGMGTATALISLLLLLHSLSMVGFFLLLAGGWCLTSLGAIGNFVLHQRQRSAMG
jgi:MFS family permease